jgi:thioredoxin-like negative regulator of GroEL
MRQAWLTLVLVCVGCQSFTERPPARLPPPAQLPVNDLPTPQPLAEMEQKAIKQAKELADHKQENEACALLADFVGKYPDRCEAHLVYGSLLLQTKQIEAARGEFEEFLKRCKDTRPERIRMLIQAHEGLADIAKGSSDVYGEHLHRGIGLYLMTLNHNGYKVGETVFPNARLLDEALKALNKAHEMRPDEARPCWYIHRVYLAMNQMEQAEEFLKLTDQRAANTRLTPLERHALDLAVRSMRAENSSN